MYLWAVANDQMKCFANCLLEGYIKIDGRGLSDFMEYETMEDMIDHYLEITGKSKAKSFAIACFTFSDIHEGDIVVAANFSQGVGYTALAWGIVTSDYIYNEDSPKYQHSFKVDWHEVESVIIPPKERAKSFMKECKKEKPKIIKVLNI